MFCYLKGFVNSGRYGMGHCKTIRYVFGHDCMAMFRTCIYDYSEKIVWKEITAFTRNVSQKSRPHSSVLPFISTTDGVLFSMLLPWGVSFGLVSNVLVVIQHHFYIETPFEIVILYTLNTKTYS